MPHERIVRRVAHDAPAMFGLVADVERYPEFLPGCRGLSVLRRDSDGEIEVLTADMTVGHRLITERFTCRVRLDRPALAIDVDYLSGPLSRLENRWRFRPLEGRGSEIEFSINFELRSRGLGLVVGALFDRVFLRFVDAFEARADTLFTDPSQRVSQVSKSR